MSTKNLYFGGGGGSSGVGLPGDTGAAGPVGLAGPIGLSGAPGATGPDGLPGTSGSRGPSGLPGTTSFSNFSDTIISSPTTNQVIKFNGSGWINGTDLTTTGVGGQFATLTDVNVVEVANNEKLTYNNGYLFQYGSFPIRDARDMGFVGDGQTQNLLAWSGAIQALNNSGGTLYFPGPAVYTIYSTGLLTSYATSPNTFNSRTLGILTRSHTNIILDNDAEIRWVSNIPLGVTGVYLYLMSINTQYVNVVGGSWTFSGAPEIFYTGVDVDNGHWFYANGSNTSYCMWKDCTFSGIGFGPTAGYNDQTAAMQHNIFDNVKFIDWGGGEPNHNIYHQGGVHFRNCLFKITSISGQTQRAHSHAIYTGADRPYSKYFDCRFENVSHNQITPTKYAFHFFGSITNATSHGIVVEDCVFNNCLAPIIHSNTNIGTVINNCSFRRPDTSGLFYLPPVSITSPIGVRITNCQSADIQLDQSRDCIISNNNNVGVSLQTRPNVRAIADNNICAVFDSTSNAQRNLDIACAVDSIVSNNRISNTIGAAVATICRVESTAGQPGTKNILFFNNHFISSNTAGFPIVEINRSLTYSYFKNNHFTLPGATPGHGFALAHGGTGLIFDGNIFFAPKKVSASIANGGTLDFPALPTSGILIQNNMQIMGRGVGPRFNVPVWSRYNIWSVSGNFGTGVMIYDIGNITGGF